jgi:hypothetical protein
MIQTLLSLVQWHLLCWNCLIWIVVLSESFGTPISNIGVCGTHVGVVGRNLANCKNSKQELFYCDNYSVNTQSSLCKSSG